MPAAPAWQRCGQHSFYLRDDVLFWDAHGLMTVPDLKVMFEERMAVQRQHGHVFLLLNAQALGSTPAESRRYAVEFKPDPPIRGAVVLFGAGLIVRTAVSLVLGAARLLGRRDLRTVFFVADEAEAWATIDRERQTLSNPPLE